jgi:hypothetical protein
MHARNHGDDADPRDKAASYKMRHKIKFMQLKTRWFGSYGCTVPRKSRHGRGGELEQVFPQVLVGSFVQR